MRLAAVAAALLLSACVFSSEEPLFSSAEAAHPFADGALFAWRDPDEPAPIEVVFRRAGATYDIIERTKPAEPMNDVLVVAIPDTPEEDYVVQWRGDLDQTGRAYAFMWRVNGGYRVFTDPSAFEPGEGAKRSDAFCERRAYGECVFATRSDLMSYYRAIAYPVLAATSGAEGTYLELTPIAGGEAGGAGA